MLFRIKLLYSLICTAILRLLYRVKLPYKIKYTVTLGLLCLMIVGLSPFLASTDIHPPWDNTRDNLSMFLSKGLDPPKVDFGEVVPALEEIRAWLGEQRKTEGFFRTVWMPGERVLQNKILFRYDVPTFKAQRELDHMMLVLLPLIREYTKDVGKLLAQYNVKYIIVYRDPLTSEEDWQEYYEGPPRLLLQVPYGFAPAGAPSEYIRLLDKQNDLKLMVDKPEYRIYKNMDFTIPHISAYNRLFLIAPPDVTNGMPAALEESYVLSRELSVIQNSGFEAGSTYWFEDGIDGIEGATASIDNTTAYMGQSSLKLGLEPGANDIGVQQLTKIKGSQRFRMTAGLRSENASSVQFKAYFSDSAGDRIKHDGADSLQANLGIKPGENWDWVQWNFNAPPNAVEMDIQLNMIHWMKVNEDKSATIWLDEINVEEWSFVSGHAFSNESIPIKFLHGQSMAVVPELLSKIPDLDPSKHLLVFGDFFSSEETGEEYRKMADTVIFFGDYDRSGVADKWIEEPESLLFFHDVESAIHFIPAEESKELVEIADDNQAEFWQGGVGQRGSVGAPRFSNVGFYDSRNESKTAEGFKGADSLKISVGSGDGLRWHFGHTYAIPQDWSGKDFISLYWYGGNSGASLRFIAATEVSAESVDYFYARFSDDFTGWKQIVLPFTEFQVHGKPSWGNITFLEFQTDSHNLEGTWYLDRMVVDVNPTFPVVTGISDVSAGTSGGLDNVLVVDERGKLVKQFFAPRANYFRVMIRAAVEGEILLKINDEPLNVTDLDEGEGSFKWYESGPVYLETGDHTLSIDVNDNETIWDQILILSTDYEETTFKDIFYTDPIDISWIEEKPSEYSVQVNSNGPTLIVLGEAFHEEWKASTADGENLKHMPALPLDWANGFYLLQGGEKQVKILFGLQETKDIAVTTWIVTWICLIVGIIGSWIVYYRRRFKR